MKKLNVLFGISVSTLLVLTATSLFANGGQETQTAPAAGASASGNSSLNWTLAKQTEIGYMASEGVAYGNSKFVALMQTEGWKDWWRPGDPFPKLKILYSTDGINWTVKDTALREVWKITFSNGRFFAIEEDGNSFIASSTDGENWMAAFNTNGVINGPVYGNGKWVFVTRNYGNGGHIMYSTDGITWSAAANSSCFDFNAVAYGANKFIAMDRDGKFAYSADGVTWTVHPGTHGNLVHYITYGNGKFVKIGWEHTSYSEDGLNWKYIDFFGFDGSTASHTVYEAGKFVAIEYEGRMVTSVDGIT
jgi:hypothetical protein